MAHTLSRKTLAKLQSQPERIRNMCILAHVDHGKTTLSDNLLSSNGIISSKLAGRVRYLDSTEEEQARGITMKASAVALVHNDEPFRELRKRTPTADASAGDSAPSKIPYLINLIDSPGHVDFSMDVAAAARLCDGAIVVVDAVEGVCIQTHAVLRTAWAEGVRPCLVLNKVDRLITELRLSPLEAYGHLSRIIEAANVIMSSLYTAELMARKSGGGGAAGSALEVTPGVASGNGDGLVGTGAGSAAEARAAVAAHAAQAAAEDAPEKELQLGSDGAQAGSGQAGANSGPGPVQLATDGWAIEVDEAEESKLFFDPTRGNVVFASAYDGWAFSVDDFAALHASRLEVPRALLRKALWGNFYYRSKTKKIVTGAAAAAASKGKTLAVSLMLEPLWAVYDCTVLNPVEDRQAKIIKSLSLEAKVNKRDITAKDGAVRAQAILKAWMPLADAVLGMVVRVLPSPREAGRRRLAKLWPQLTAAAAAEDAQRAQDAAAGIPLSPDMPLSARLARVRAAVENCDTSPDADVVLFVSKMFAIDKMQVPSMDGAYEPSTSAAVGASVTVGTLADLGSPAPSDASQPVSQESTAFPQAMRGVQDRAWWGMDMEPVGSPAGSGLDLRPVAAAVRQAGALRSQGQDQQSSAQGGDEGEEDANSAETFIAFARVFSGVLRPDTPVFVLGPRYDPRDPQGSGSVAAEAGAGTGGGKSSSAQISLVTRPLPLYLMMGRDLSPIPAAYAGNVVGIGRLGAHVLKTATLCTTPACASLSPMTFQTTPLVRVAVEPSRPSDLAALERGLALLDQADPCVEVSVSDSGELQLAALGELHLQRCITDLTTRFARVGLSVSPPILSFCETITAPAKPQAIPQTVQAAIVALQRAGGLDGSGALSPGAVSAGSSAAVGTPTTGSFAFDGEEEDGKGAKRGTAGAAGGQVALNPAAPFNLHLPGRGLQFSACWMEPVGIAGTVLHLPTGIVHATTADRGVSLRLRALPLPLAITRHLEEGGAAMRMLMTETKRDGRHGGSADADGLPAQLQAFTSRLFALATEAGGEWPELMARVWGFGPRGAGPNMLCSKIQPEQLLRQVGLEDSVVNSAPVAAALQSVWTACGVLPSSALSLDGAAPTLPPSLLPALSAFRSALLQGFGLASNAGPLCAEPLWGVCFVLESAVLAPPATAAGADQAQVSITVSSGSLMSTMRDGCKTAFECGQPRLVEALYRCELQCSGGRGGGGEALGKCYGVLSKRRARVLAEDIAEGTQTFIITALLPVVESHGFSDDLRKKTSGAATSPQLLFSHWEVLDSDPWGSAEAEAGLGTDADEDAGDAANTSGATLSRRYIDSVRQRKGLPLDKKLVQHADKQRNLSRKK